MKNFALVALCAAFVLTLPALAGDRIVPLRARTNANQQSVDVSRPIAYVLPTVQQIADLRHVALSGVAIQDVGEAYVTIVLSRVVETDTRVSATRVAARTILQDQFSSGVMVTVLQISSLKLDPGRYTAWMQVDRVGGSPYPRLSITDFRIDDNGDIQTAEVVEHSVSLRFVGSGGQPIFTDSGCILGPNLCDSGYDVSLVHHPLDGGSAELVPVNRVYSDGSTVTYSSDLRPCRPDRIGDKVSTVLLFEEARVAPYPERYGVDRVPIDEVNVVSAPCQMGVPPPVLP